jgi:hypothetical protein
VQNHAAHVSRQEVLWFQFQCGIAQAALRHGAPLRRIFGTHLQTESGNKEAAPEAPAGYESLDTSDYGASEWGERRPAQEYEDGPVEDEEPPSQTSPRPREEYPAPDRRAAPRARSFGFRRSFHTTSRPRNPSRPRVAVMNPEPAAPAAVRSALDFMPAVPPHVLLARKSVIARTQDTLRRAFGGSLEVRAFGSTQYGVSRADSDLDLVIVVRIAVPFHTSSRD